MLDIICSNSKNKKKTLVQSDSLLYEGDCLKFLDLLPKEPVFDLVITSPPYNIGKSYEKKTDLRLYLEWQKKVIQKIYPFIKPNGSLCWQVGNYIDNGEIVPLDIELANIFKDKKVNMQMRNRIVWTYGHGLHSKKRFSGRYEVVLWYTKTDEYTFNLDAVRVPAKYPGKRAYKGPRVGQLSGNPLGKNPADVWEIPNVKGNHIEKTVHPCQFPVALIERLVKALTNPGDLVFDPFCGVASSGVAAILNDRRYWGCDTIKEYIDIGAERLRAAETRMVSYRPLNKPVYDPSQSNLSKMPEEWLRMEELKDE